MTTTPNPDLDPVVTQVINKTHTKQEIDKLARMFQTHPATKLAWRKCEIAAIEYLAREQQQSAQFESDTKSY